MTCDPEGFPPYLLKQVGRSVAYPLSLIFNSFMSISTIPSVWKHAVITPIYKKGLQSNPGNYRPISLTSIFSKLMERCIATKILDFLQTSKLLSNHQHGFLPKKSTLTNLLESVRDWTLSIENKAREAVVYIDFTRAFDLVQHSKLLHKLRSYGITGGLLNWIESFLSSRTHCTKVGDAISTPTSIRSGVIQGSCIGPLLFLIYIDDITQCIQQPVSIKLYADDVKLYTSIESVSDCSPLQSCIQRISEWSVTWQLPMSVGKCCSLNIATQHNKLPPIPTFQLGNQLLPTCSQVRDLGIIVDESLTFNINIATIVQKAHARSNLILRCFTSKHCPSLLRAYKTYVRPLIEYNSPVWSPTTKCNIDRIEKVQRQFTKRLPGMKGLSYGDRLTFLNIPTLELRRLRTDLLLTYKIVFGLINIDSQDFFSLRNNVSDLKPNRGHQYKLLVNKSRTDKLKYFFSNRIVNVWNGLPATNYDFRSLISFRNFLLTQTAYFNQFLKCDSAIC
jgi:ribonucleases P/MRP protein subunit RPP40